MTDNINISKVRSLVHTDQLENVDNIHSLQKVSEDIQHAMESVNNYRNQINSLQPPLVNGKPWYKFSFGKASVTEVNNVLESFSNYVQESFKMVATTQEKQNENDMNICRLVGLLAIAEANSYEKLQDLSTEMKDLSTEDEESAKQLKELEKSFLQSLDDSAIDSSKKEEQMSRLIDYVTLFAESKTKKIRSISLSLSEIKKKLDDYCKIQDLWIEKANKKIISWEEEVNNNFAESQEKFISQSKEETSQALNTLVKKREDDTKAIQNELKDLHDKIEKQVNESFTEIEEKSNALVKSQEEFISQSKEETALALSELQKEAKLKTMEIQEQTDGFIENQNALFEKIKKQQRIYKVVSISALAVSLASLLYAILI